MKKTTSILLFLFSINLCNSQHAFNKIIEDTIYHLNPSIAVLDTGYIVMSGTGTTGWTIDDIRCFSLIFLDLNGEKIWERKMTDYQNQYWEGWSNSFKKSGNISYSTGGKVNSTDGISSTYIFIFDSLYNIISENYIDLDSGHKRSFNIILSSTENFYLVGQFSSEEIDGGLASILKTDSSGNQIWHKTTGGYGSYSSPVIETSSKDILVGGCKFDSRPNQYWYLVKIDTAGNILWEKTYGTSKCNNHSIKDISETSDSCYILAGDYPAAGHIGVSSSSYYWDGCLRKVDKNGELIWEKKYRNYTYYIPIEGITDGHFVVNAHINSIIRLDNGDIMAVGSTQGSTSVYRGCLLRLDPEGNIKWHRYYYAENENTTSQWLRVVQPTPDKGFILGGDGDMYDQWPGGYDPGQQLWMVKTDSLGIDGLCYTETPALNVDIDIPDTLPCNQTISTYMYISGKSAPYKLELSTGQKIDSIFYPFRFIPVELGLGEVFLSRGQDIKFYDTITEATFTNHEWGQCIVKPMELQTPATTGYHDLEITVTDAYGETKTITKTVFVHGDCNSDVEDNQSYQNFRIFPNPATDKVYIEFYDHSKLSCGNALIILYTTDGKQVQSKTLTNIQNIETLDITNLTDGIYIIEITDCYGNKTSKKITKQ
ncbi:T9SS type A sorting domain-containing protein [Bacteroidales bacterium OttesenSCG-928-I21]|nr:T9SS type A sorting domain-containing protein [Bacteroidales bacterium OttesenSCG-928-I21]